MLQTRLIKVIGTSAKLRRYWGNDCPKTGSYHNAEVPLMTTEKIGDWDLGGRSEDYGPERWPTKCDHCGVPVPETAEKQIFRNQLYNTVSGRPEPGDMYYADWYPCSEARKDQMTGYCIHGWENCDGKHLFVVLPNGFPWDVNSRANNCTLPDDKTHRCWVQHGDPETGKVTIDKNGKTCAAGAGSILVPGWHGFLRNGVLVPC